MKLLLILMISITPFTSFSSEVNFIAFGDAPYFVPEANSMFDKLRLQVDKQKVDFVVHVGDIRGGATTCSDQTLLDVKSKFEQFNTPLIYTPGDNEWTDCHRYEEDPINRLSFIRKNFFRQIKALVKILFY